MFSMEQMETKSEKYSIFWISLFLVVITLALYWPVRTYDFVKYDDYKYAAANRYIQSGITSKSIRWAFTSGYASNWHPVTWLSHMLDYEIFGLNPGAYHLVNLCFHIVNTLLILIVFFRMTKALWPSAFIAAVFALHPLHVESVAWIAERKDVLSTFFWMLTMLAYVKYTEKTNALRYIITLLLFAMGLMAKPMLVSLPLVLLLLDYWPLERIKLNIKAERENTRNNNPQGTLKKESVLRMFIEKIPFFILTVLSSIVTFIAQQRSGAVQPFDVIDIKSRTGNAIISFVGYISKMLWPSRLAVLYPHPGDSLSLIKVVFFAILLILCTIVVILLSRKHKYFVTGWFWYIITLIPVIGLVQVGIQSMADRYMYIPMTGLLIIIAWGVKGLTASWKHHKRILTASAVLILSAMFVKTSVQLQYWQNSFVLFEHALDVTSNNYIMHNNFGAFLDEQGQMEQAIEQFQKSLAIKPNSAETRNNLANVLRDTGKADEAINEYYKAIKLKPNFSDAHYNLAIALSSQNKVDEAINEYREAIRLSPDNVDAVSNLALELSQKGDYSQSVELYKKALEIEPDNVITHGRFGLALSNLGDNEQAIREFQIVLKSRPDDTEMICNVAIILERQGNISEAIEQYKKALAIDPEYTKAKNLLIKALEKKEN
jgi:tetratricopeptide (TPR) repeat protein